MGKEPRMTRIVDKNGTGRVCVQLSNGLATSNRPGGQYFYNLVDDNSSVR